MVKFITIIGCLLTVFAIGNDRPTIAKLQDRLELIDRGLSDLASPSLRSGVGNVGYRSRSHNESSNTEWIQIDWQKEQLIDQVILVPAIWRDSKKNFLADGFPQAFRIIGGTANGQSKVLTTFEADEYTLPRITPLVIDLPPTPATWIKLEVTQLNQRAWDNRYVLQLSEILVFSDNNNVALKQTVTASTPVSNDGGARNRSFLVDGFLPYLMDAAQGEQSFAFLRNLKPNAETQPIIQFDLGKSYQINNINLHNIDLGDTIPQTNASDFALPEYLIIQGANQSDYSDAVTIVELKIESLNDIGPIIMLRTKEHTCRYIRFIASKTKQNPSDGLVIGFAEIEIFDSIGKNVALGLEPAINFDRGRVERPVSNLTDGRNLYGNILPIRTWLNQLAMRHDLEIEKPILQSQLNGLYNRQKQTLTKVAWLAGFLGLGIILTIIFSQIHQRQREKEIRQRLAADLHDDLGANLHSIRLLGDVALSAQDSPERLEKALLASQDLVQRASRSVKDVIEFQQNSRLSKTLEELMHEAAQRIMANLDYDMKVQGGELLEQLKPRDRNDLYLFFKEGLVNIIRHSEATSFWGELTADSERIHLILCDDGSGLVDDLTIPKSLKRRADLLGASVVAGSSEFGGAKIELVLPFKQHLPRLRRSIKRWMERKE